MSTSFARDLTLVAERLIDGLSPVVVEEVVLTGSVSRGVADEFSNIEMLLVTAAPLGIDDCFELGVASRLVAA